ncbi:MAG: RNA 3'-phosphate cyclase [Rhodospirillales bacterium]|nr:MAG: RNA 3'-phosphate cyclase [Rhodospirillales bacterium]
MTGPLVIDGAHGEGGGQIVRSSVAFSAMLARPVRIENIRAGRRKPGLAAQHVTAIRAAAAICGARVSGDALGSHNLEFSPRHRVRAGHYAFDVAEAREGGSAGAAGLVLQTVLLPLALTTGDSRVAVEGGTHTAWSPPFDYLDTVWLPALHRLGVTIELRLESWGWFPLGKGCIEAMIRGRGPCRLAPVDCLERGELVEIRGRAVAANLPAHIPQRMSDRARALLEDLRVPIRIAPLRVRAACAGAGIFLTAVYQHVRCGFSALGARGKSSETVAEDAVAALLSHHRSGAALDLHLGDQILAALAFSHGPSSFSVESVTRHLRTNAWLIEQFGLARTVLEIADNDVGFVRISPQPDRA